MSTTASSMNEVVRPRTRRLLDRIGIPHALVWGYVGVLIFMVGDGVESNYLAPYIASLGYGEQRAATAITIYGVTVAIGAWLSGSLSTIWGPRRVMAIGAGIWVVFEVLFLAAALPSGNFVFVLVAYGLRGIAYPLFSYSFLVWINSASPVHQRGTSAGWFWFAFTGGLPTLGSLTASGTIPLIGQRGTFWLSLGIVAIGACVALFGVRDRTYAGPVIKPGQSKTRELFQGIDILWKEPKIALGGLVRVINTSPEFGAFIFMPFFFTHTIGFSLPEYLLLVSIIYATNIGANLLFGFIGDRFGWRRTVTWCGAAGSAISVLLFYYGPLAAGDNFLVAALCGAFFGFTLAGYVPLTALLPSMVGSEKRGNAYSIYNLGAGLATFVGPAIVSLFEGLVGPAGLVWIFAVLYVVSALIARTFYSTADPVQSVRKGLPRVNA